MGITQAILRLRADYARDFGLSPAGINGGECMNFAADIARKGFGEDIWGDDLDYDYFWSEDMQAFGFWFAQSFMSIHCFIMYEGKFYDSETPQGCDYADDLPCYQRNIDMLYEDM